MLHLVMILTKCRSGNVFDVTGTNVLLWIVRDNCVYVTIKIQNLDKTSTSNGIHSPINYN